MTSLRNTQSSLSNRTSSRQISLQSSRSNIFGASVSKRNVAFDSSVEKAVPKKSNVKIYDEFGVDVTPRSLLTSYSTGSNERKSSKTNFNDSFSVMASGEMFNQSVFCASTVQSSFAAGFSKSILSSIIGGGSHVSLDSVADDINYANLSNFNVLQDFHIKHTNDVDEEKEILSDADIKKMISITLEETDTIWHLDIQGVTVPIEDSLHVKKRNEIYDQLCKNRVGNDMYVDRGMQTFNDAYKTKDTQTLPILFKEQSCQVNGWEIYDVYKELTAPLTEDNDDDDILGYSFKKHNVTEAPNNVVGTASTALYSSTQSLKTQSILSESTTTFGSESMMSVIARQESFASEKNSLSLKQTNDEMLKLLKNGTIKESLFFMERVILQNLFQDKQAAYRGLVDFKFTQPTAEECSGENQPSNTVPNLMQLWSYECPITKGMSVNCMVWNKSNKDLLAVGYGSEDFHKGKICIWSVKNPEFPERVYTLNSAATSIDFSTSSPNFLAVGLYNGGIAVYNVRSNDDSVVVDSMDSDGKHGAPVWQLKWIERDRGTSEEKGEVLVSASADGRVSQWSIRKGFEYLDLMRLKRASSLEQNSKKKNEKKSDALISRLAAGMCFDFHPSEGNMYLVGTEEGLIHRCSCSYNEQFLETYSDHKGPLYCLLWSPFDRDVFMSCSADWTIRLWTLEKTESILTLQASTKAIIDVDWSPTSHSLLCAINDHHIELWNLCNSTLDPILTVIPETTGRLTSIKFALNSEALLVGDSEGRVTVYLMQNIPSSTDIRLKNLLNTIQKNDGKEENDITEC